MKRQAAIDEDHYIPKEKKMENDKIIKQAVDTDDTEKAKLSEENGGLQSKKYEDIKYLSPPEIRKEKFSIWCNVICLFLSNSLISCGRMALFNSVTSLVPDHTLAMVSLTVVGISQYAGSIILLTPIGRIINLKHMLLLGMFLSCMQIFAFFYPTWGVFVTASLCLGLGMSIIFSLGYAYANIIGYWYHRIFGGNLSVILVLMTSVINMSVCSGFLTGNLILFAVLNPQSISISNSSENDSSDIGICGVNYCNEDLSNSTVMSPPPPDKYTVLITIFTVLAVFGVIGSLFMGNISDKKPKENAAPQDACSRLKQMFQLAKSPYAIILAILSIFIGLEQSFMIADYTKPYVGCSLGIAKMGYSMMSLGLSMMIISSVHWYLVKLVGRPILIICSYILFMAMFLILLLWPVNGYSSRLFFILAFVYGLADSLWTCVITSVYAFLFKENVEGALSLANFWRSCGLIYAYSAAHFFCITTKLYILITACTLAVILYLILEIHIYKNISIQDKQAEGEHPITDDDKRKKKLPVNSVEKSVELHQLLQKKV